MEPSGPPQQGSVASRIEGGPSQDRRNVAGGSGRKTPCRPPVPAAPEGRPVAPMQPSVPALPGHLAVRRLSFFRKTTLSSPRS